MTPQQVMKAAEKQLETLELPEQTRNIMRLLVECLHNARQSRGASVQVIAKKEESLSYYSRWHGSDEVPKRKWPLLVKNRLISTVRGTYNVYECATYKDGKFYVKNEEFKITGWAYMPVGKITDYERGVQE